MPENMLIIEADCVEYRKNLEIRAKTIRAKKKTSTAEMWPGMGRR